MATDLDSENNSAKSRQIEISFVTSNKSKPMIIYENYLFKRTRAFIRFINVNWEKNELLLYCEFSLSFFLN